jgi:L-lactate dehydrogenase complex protein LldG
MVQKERSQMTSREKILSAVKQNQPSSRSHDRVTLDHGRSVNLLSEFKAVLQSIGGSLYLVKSKDEIDDILSKSISPLRKVYSTDAGVFNGASSKPVSGHGYADLDLCVLKSDLAVAENGAVWLSDKELPHRALPFITQHLAVVILERSIVSSMHEAYNVIGDKAYDYGVFIAGPSKTADIEQSLVLGAHGAMSMTVFVLEE